jgi:hypothetical protein
MFNPEKYYSDSSRKLKRTVSMSHENTMYCLKCKTKRQAVEKSLRAVVLPNPKREKGVNAVSGICSVCGSKMMKIVSLYHCLN